jgi:hypothetical protein
MFFVRCACVVMALFVAGCVTKTQTPPLSSVHQSNITIGSKVIPLPPGEWIYVGDSAQVNNIGVPLVDIVLARVQDNELLEAMYVRTNTQINRPGNWWLAVKDCYRNDVHAMHVAKSWSESGQECWFVNHWRMTMSGKIPEYWIEARSAMDELGVDIPINMIATQHYLIERAHYLNYIRFYNPEAEGFDPPQRAEWNTSDWHPDRVIGDAEKEEYVSEIERRGEQWQAFLKANS